MGARSIETDNQTENPSGLYPRQFYARGGEMRIGLVPDDVLLVPRAVPEPGLREEWGQGFVHAIPDEAFNDPNFQERDLSSRSNVDTTVFLDRKRKIRLRIPVVSSPMFDVTGTKLATALGKEGGVGIIHRAQSIQSQAKEVEAVKGAMGFVFERPPTLPPTATVYDAREKMDESNRGIVAVTDESDRVIGIVTRRKVKKDVAPQDLLLSDPRVMTPRNKLVTVLSEGVDTNDPNNIIVRRSPNGKRWKAQELMWEKGIEKLIMIDGEGKLLGAITDYDLRQYREHPKAAFDEKGHLYVGAAVGISGNYLARVDALVNAGADFICLDIANAYLKTVREAMYKIKKRYPSLSLMVGSTATRQAVRTLKDSQMTDRKGMIRILEGEGADMIRNNIGSGSICITRGVSGFGYPSLTSTLEVSDEADKYGIPVIADGGIRYSSDMAKHLAAGASAVMLGRLLAAAEEANGDLIIDPDTRVRRHVYRGMASESVRRLLELAEGKKVKHYSKEPEGVPDEVTIIGTVEDIITSLIRGLQSGATYGGVQNMEQFRNEIDFIRGTSATAAENGTRR